MGTCTSCRDLDTNERGRMCQTCNETAIFYYRNNYYCRRCQHKNKICSLGIFSCPRGLIYSDETHRMCKACNKKSVFYYNGDYYCRECCNEAQPWILR